eukprot:s6297_g7.t1
MHGALKGRNLEAGIVNLLEQWRHSDSVLLSLDLRKGFDYADANHSLKVLEHYGFCDEWLRYLTGVWERQLRVSQIGPHVTSVPEVAQFTTRRPAPLWRSAWLVPAAVATSQGNRVAQALFVDDRNLVVRGAAQALAKQAEWMGWCRYLGLYENSGKAAFVAKHLRDQKYLLEHTQPDRVRQQARVLGVDLSRTRRGRHLTLELATKVKERLYVSRCVSVGAWGCWLKTFRDSFGFGSRVKTLLQGHPSASRDLWALLTGHIVDMEFVATLRSFGALARGPFGVA